MVHIKFNGTLSNKPILFSDAEYLIWRICDFEDMFS